MPQIGHIHKFIHKYPTKPEDRPIMWRIIDVEYMPTQYNTFKFGFKAQEELTIPAKTTKMIRIPIAYSLRRGHVFVSLKNEFRLRGLVVLDGVLCESSQDGPVVNIQNNSDNNIVFNVGDEIGYISHSSAN